MRILLVNDDGIKSPGIELLARAASELGEVWVVAPDRQCSGMSQKLTLFEETRVCEESFPAPVQGAWSVGGTPADCVKLALDCILDERPDYVFSGINDGYNAGYDIVYSGTVGACYEAVMNGVPAIAFSAMTLGSLEVAREHLLPIARELIAMGQAPGEIWNVNFPGCTPEELGGVLYERSIAPMQMYEADYSMRPDGSGNVLYSQRGFPIAPGIAPEGSDIAALHRGYISVGKIKSPVM